MDNGITPHLQPRADNKTFRDSVLFTADNVHKTSLSVKPSTSSGSDGIPNVLFKNPAHSTCNALCYIFYSSFKSHCPPSQWLQAFVIPVFKKGTTSDPANYRPISLTNTCCRVMEHNINIHLTDYLFSNQLISKHQHDFLVRHSTCINLLETLNDWTIVLDDHHKTYAIYMTFRKHLTLYLIPNYLLNSALIILEEIRLLGLLPFWTIGHNRLSSITAYLIIFS